MLNSLNYTSLGSFFHLIKEVAFDRHEVTIFLKENVSRLCVRICVQIFILKMVYILTPKHLHIVCIFSHLYVIKFTN